MLSYIGSRVLIAGEGEQVDGFQKSRRSKQSVFRRCDALLRWMKQDCDVPNVVVVVSKMDIFTKLQESLAHTKITGKFRKKIL